MDAREMDRVSEVQLFVNGTEYKVLNPKPDIYLGDWLRNNLHLTGLKTVCKEGGCGSCIVAVSKVDPLENTKSICAVNSCLQPLISLDGHHIITVEGLGGKKQGFHALQERFAEKFASQCGFCTPGFVMNGFSLLASGSKGKTKKEIEDNLDGNICRCTGYRPILDAFKSFAKEESPVDIEDMLKPKCFKNCLKSSPKIIDHAKDIGSNAFWYKPNSLADLYTIAKKLEPKSIKFVVGNTGSVLLKDKKCYDAYIELSSVKSLNEIKRAEQEIKIGSAATLTRIIESLEQEENASTSLSVVSEYFRKIGSLPVRNVATWAGNLMLIHKQRDFPSDVFLAFETIGATLEIVDMNNAVKRCSLQDFLQTNMTNKLILSATLPFVKDDASSSTKLYKIMPRKQNSYGHVSAGFHASFDSNNETFKERPIIMFGGIGLEMDHADKLEDFLEGKQINNDTFQDAVKLLDCHLKPNLNSKLVDFQYCKAVAINLFYKFCLHLRGTKACQRSLKSCQSFDCPVSSGEQSFHVSDTDAPLNQPIERIEGKLQASGQNVYVGDLPKYQTELYAALVTAKKGCANLKGINHTEASKHPGFIGLYTEKDIPGTNNWLPPNGLENEIFASKNVEFFGQSLAIVIADSQTHANEIAEMVDVEYSDVKQPITSLKEAIEQKNFFPKRFPDIKIGNHEEAFKSCDHVIEGEIDSGSQHHFHMEPQTCLVVPEANGFTVFSATQSAVLVQEAVSHALGINASSVDVQVPRLGGAFGGKIQYPSQYAAATATAANALNRPIRMTMTLNDNLTNAGKRPPVLSTYKVGFNKDGKLLACDVKIYCDCGCTNLAVDGLLAATYLDNGYFCPNWNVEIIDCRTNTPSNTFTRAPGVIQGIFFMEVIMDHIASFLGRKTPEEIKEINLYKDDQITITGRTLSNCLLDDVWGKIKIKSNFEERKAKVAEFNKEHKWKKRGIAMMPLKYDIGYLNFNFTALVSIYYADGTVAISHGGVEMGQGVNTRVCQVAAKLLGIPMDLISVKPMSTITSPNSYESGASITSELNCLAVHKSCEILLERIAPIRERYPDKSWKELIQKCGDARVDLSAQHMFYDSKRAAYAYSTYGAACSEVEVDILTGEHRILRTDVMFDCGESVNPRLDIGQAEGSFVMGIGYWFTEKIVYDAEHGRPLTSSTWTYKPPMPKDIPTDMRIYLLHETTNPIGYIRSKAIGEPVVCMSAVCLFAVKRAIEAARNEMGAPLEYFHFDAPATVDVIQRACKVEAKHLIM